MGNQIDSKALKQLVEDLRTTHGENLASVVLYGSAAAGDYIERRSDHNLLIVLKKITSEDLRLSQAPMREWQRLGQPMPVYFTVEELNNAADVFPIEFLQMEKARKVLHGSDPFESMKISKDNLRHQTEYELRTKLIQLRRLYIPASISGEKLSALISDSFVSFAALFRPVLMLLGHEPPITKEESVRAMVRLVGMDGSPFERILELRAKGGSSLTEAEANELFAAYLAQIEQVIKVVDGIQSRS
ncbi:MAG TPA: nucleotidyltransferase domain-containing protein [Blastocatellia bacterium]|jgi:predicted nucleotidyltransferase|nr:nucleotidyltransferase domain-containing protein [Blastocatellia bacterium]